MYGHSAYENDVKNTSGVVTAKVGVTNPTRVLEYRPNTYSVTVNYKTNRTHQEPSLVTSKTTSGLFGYSISVEPQTLTGYTSPSTYTKTINESIIINNQNYVEPTAQVFTIKSYDLTINYVWHGSHESGKINGGSAGTSKTESVEYKSSKSIASYTNITGYSPYLDTNRTNSASTAGVGSMPASDKTITVYYLPNIYTVTLNTVSGGNLYVNRQANSVTAEYKSKVLLENKANADYVWNYYTVGGNNQYQPYFTITGNTTVSGSFTKFFNTPTITVKDTPSSVNLDALPGLITYKKLGNNIDGSGKIYTQHKYSNEYIGDISRYNGFDVSFWDYNSLTWSNANGNHAEVANGYPKSQWGIGTLSTAWFPVVITPQTKVIRLYTGVWQATNTIKVYKNSGTTPIVSTSFSAGGTAAKKVVDINVSTTVTDCVNIQLVTSNAESGGNSTLAAVALLDGSNGYEQALTLDQSSTNYNITLNQKLNGSSNYVSLYYKRYKAGSIESGCVEGKNYVASDFSGDNFWDFDYLVNNARDGMGRGDEIKITLSNVDSRVKVIRVLTGVWRAKNTTSLSGGWVATAPTFESDASVDGSGNAIGNAKANCIDFYVNTTMPATITLTIKKTALDSLVSNVSLVGIAFYGNPFEIVCGTTSQYVVSREDATQSVIDGRTVYNLPQSYYDNTDKSSYASLHNGKITKIGDVDALVDESDVSSLLYWEHYNSDGNGGTYTATSSTSIKDYVTYCNVSRNPSANNFNDYLIPISWDYGTSSEEEYSKGLGSYDYNVMGCVAGQHVNQAGAVCATIQVPAGNTYLRVFTGALNCTCKVFITYNNGVLAERLETAGSKADSVAMNFMIDSDSAATIDLIIMVENPTDPTNNVVLTAIALGQGV